jgi:molybdopterin-biosynthesis enzyme MoeA-like protein
MPIEMPARFGLLIVGDEILSGKRTDKHFAHVVGLLRDRGLRLSWTQYLPDERASLVEVLRRTLDSDAIVFSCGGIGATPDDHTRQAVAEALGVPLELHPEARALIAQRCAENGQPDMTTAENLQRLKMGEFPVGARIIPNPYNRIPGFSIGQHHFVPGFPVMAWPMIAALLDSTYAHLANAVPQAERAVLVFETAESVITPLMVDVEARFARVKAFSLPSVGDGQDGRPARRHIELGVKGPPEDVEAAFAMVLAGLARLGAPTGIA